MMKIKNIKRLFLEDINEHRFSKEVDTLLNIMIVLVTVTSIIYIVWLLRFVGVI